MENNNRSYKIAAFMFSGVSVGLLIIHMVDHKATIDYISVALLVLAGLPWILPLLRHLELPGGIKMDLKEGVEEVQQLAKQEGFIDSASVESIVQGPDDLVYEQLLKQDPNLALAAMRLNLERQLTSLLVDKTNIQFAGIGRILEMLRQRGTISQSEYVVIQHIVPVLNKAVHGSTIDPHSARRIISIGLQLMHSLKDANATDRSHKDFF